MVYGGKKITRGVVKCILTMYIRRVYVSSVYAYRGNEEVPRIDFFPAWVKFVRIISKPGVCVCSYRCVGKKVPNSGLMKKEKISLRKFFVAFFFSALGSENSLVVLKLAFVRVI